MPKQGVRGRTKDGLAAGLIALQVWQPVLAGVVSSNPKITQDQAANGVPVVNIATPGQSGISHNTYTRFNVERQGLILNNSGQPVSTQLGGYIPGNANLHSGSARLILNEVSGNLPSQLKGYMEIAGQKAEMIIANPAGITCDGCGFINTSRGTLSTGKPLFGSDGSLNGFRVEDGMLAIDGLGLNATNTDRLNLYSRALVLNAELHARELDVVTGTNDINVIGGVITPISSSTASPVFSVDSSSLGGMYANRIRLVGTEAGVGMRLAAPVAAMNGNLEITSNGDVRLTRSSSTQSTTLHSKGAVQLDGQMAVGDVLAISASQLSLTGNAQVSSGGTTLQAEAMDIADGSEIAARGSLRIESDRLTNAGDIASASTMHVDVGGLTNTGNIMAGTSMRLAASDLTNSGIISSASGLLQIDIINAVDNHSGKVMSGHNLMLSLPAFDWSSVGGDFQASGELAIVTQGDMTFSGDIFQTPGSVRLNAGNHRIAIDSRLIAGEAAFLRADMVAIGQDGWLLVNGDVDVQARQLTNNGIILGRESLELILDERLDNQGTNRIATDGSSEYQSAMLLSEGDILIEGKSGTRLAVLNNIGSQIESMGGNIHIKANVLNNRNEGWSLSPEMRESLQAVYSDACNKYCDGLDHIWNYMFDGHYSCCYVAGGSNRAPILYESSFFEQNNLRYQNVWLYRVRSWITHRDVTDAGERSGITASASANSSNGNIFIEADVLDNDRSSISASAALDIQAREIRNTATRLHDSYEHLQESSRKSCNSDDECTRRQGAAVRHVGDYESRPDQIISAVLEGSEVNLHGAEVIWNADGEEGNVIRSQTTITLQGPWGLLPDSPTGMNSAALDPSLGAGFRLPNGGLYQRNTTPGHPYLIETDPALNTYQGFLGSGYLLSHLAWSPEVTQRRLGDSYYELMLIRDVLLASIGSRFLDPRIADERQQFEYLMQNAIAAAETLHLSAGVSLSRAQIDALQQDIVWLEEKEVLGERVLVPVVYLAQGSSRLLGNGAVIGGGTVSISGEDVRNSGLVRARDGLAIQAGQSLENRGGTLQSEGDLWLISEGDILNDSGRIRGHDVVLAAGGDITHRTWSARDIHDGSNSQSWSTHVGEQATVTATGQMLQQAGDNLQLTGARLDGTNVALAAGNNLIIDTVQLDQGYHLTDDGLEQAAAYTRHLTSQISALQHLQLQAGADLIAIAADIRAGETATLEAGGNLLLLAAEESDHYESHSDHDGSFGRSKSHDLVHDESRLLGTTISVGNVDDPEAVPGNLTLAAGKDITLYASQAVATGQVDVTAGGNLNLIAGINTVSHSEQSSKENAATYRNKDQGYIHQTAATNAISAGGDLNLNAVNDIRLTASVLHSGQTLRIGDEIVDPTVLTTTSPQRPMNVMVDTLALTNESWNETEKGFKGPLMELVKGLSFFAMMMVPAAALADDMPEVTVSEHDRVRSRDALQAASSIYAQDLDLRARGSATFVGADISVIGMAAIRAENIILDAAAESSSYTHEHGSDTVKALGINLDQDKGELRVAGVQTTKTSVRDAQDITQWRGTSLSAGNLILEAEKNIEILGSQLAVVNDALIQAGEDLTIAGKEGKDSSEHRETTETITVGLAVRNAYVDAVLAVKGLAEATDALKDAKDALDDAESKVKRGELDESDLAYFHANLAAATLNLAQAEIAAAGAVASMATTGSSGGFYASASAQREKTVSTTRSDQDVWQGSTIVAGGNAALIAGDTLTVKGSDVTVDKQAIAGADTSDANANLLIVKAREINLVAGAERSTQSSKTRTDSQGGSVSFSGGGITGGGLNAGYQEGDSEAGSLHYINSHLRAGSFSSNSDALRLRGALVEADHIDIATQTLSIVSLQDEAHSKGKSQGLSVGMGVGNKAEANAPKDYGVTSRSGSINFQKSESERMWVEEQSGIIGHDNIHIRARDTTLVGGLIANATRDENGALVDHGNLDMETETLTIRHLYDIDRSKTVGGSFGMSLSAVPASQANGTESNAPQPPQGKDKTPPPVPHNTMTVGGTYLGHDKAQTTHATLGLGRIVVGGTTLTGDNASSLGLGSLNRDLNLAQEITKDNDVGGLNFVTTVDMRLFSDAGLDDLLREQKAAAGGLVLAGMDLLTVGKVAGDVITNEVSLADAGGVLAGSISQLHGFNRYVMGNAEGAAQIEAHANGESTDLVATQAATNSLMQSINGESARLVSSGTIAGAHDSVTGTNYINAGLTDSYVSTVGHEMAHAYTRSESIAEYMGWATDVIWSTGVWANSAAIAEYKPTTTNLVSLKVPNNRLLQENNWHMTLSLASQSESFDFWGGVGHQYTMAAAAYAGGLSVEKSKMLGEAAWAPDTDSRNAMSLSSLLLSRRASGSQQSIHLLDGARDYVSPKLEAYAMVKLIVETIKDMPDLEARAYLSNRHVQEMLHFSGDAFAHVNDGPLEHYHPTLGHMMDSLFGRDPDSPNENPRAYAEMFEALYTASSRATGKRRLTLREIQDLASKISSTVVPVEEYSKNMEIDRKATARAQALILNDFLGVKDWGQKTEYGLLGYEHLKEAIGVPIKDWFGRRGINPITDRKGSK